MSSPKKDNVLGLPRNVFYAGLTSLLNDCSSEMILSIFPAFFVSVLKAGAASLGLVEGLADAAANIIKIYSGRLSDKIQKRKVFAVAGYALAEVTRPFYIVTSQVWQALGLRLVDRAGKGLRDAPRDALISLSSPPGTAGRSFGYHRAMDSMGAVIGPLIAYLILRAHPMAFNSVFITATIIGLFAVASFALVREVAVTAAARPAGARAGFSPRFKIFLVAAFVLSAGTLPVAVMLLKIQSAGFLLAAVPLFYMLYNISYSLLSPVAGKSADALGDRTVIIIGYVVLIGGYALLNFAATTWSLVAAFLFLGIYAALTDSVLRSYAARLTVEEHRGYAYGFLNGATGLGALVAGWGGGVVWATFGPSAALLSGSAIVVLGLLILALAPQWGTTGHGASHV